MNEALNFLYQFYSRFVSFLFSSYFFPGVSIGMVFIVFIIFSIMIRNLLALPNTIHIKSMGRSKTSKAKGKGKSNNNGSKGGKNP